MVQQMRPVKAQIGQARSVDSAQKPIHCVDCMDDPKVFCPRDPDAQCLTCHQLYCGAHIGPHLSKEHCVSLNLDHCSEK